MGHLDRDHYHDRGFDCDDDECLACYGHWEIVVDPRSGPSWEFTAGPD